MPSHAAPRQATPDHNLVEKALDLLQSPQSPPTPAKSRGEPPPAKKPPALDRPVAEGVPLSASPAATPAFPIYPGWLVAWRDSQGGLHGGDDERECGTVKEARYGAGGWSFTLVDGTEVPAKRIVSVAEVASDGRIIAAWTVRDHGLDGHKKVFPCGPLCDGAPEEWLDL
jgi:hypothetical protein